MPTVQKVVFLLAHQDDEVFCLHLFHLFKEAKITFFFLTDGATGGSESIKLRRSEELAEALQYLPVHLSVFQFGLLNKLRDGDLASDFSRIDFQVLNEMISDIEPDYLVSPILEGGHQDHDAVYLITSFIAKNYNISHYSFPMYSSGILPFPFFRLMSKSENYKSYILNFRSRIELLKTSILLMKTYRSQKMTWFILGLPVLFNFAFKNPVYYQDIDRALDDVKKTLFESRRTSSRDKIFSLVSRLMQKDD
jgi:LmbE family N-acetylglucosaminyl deacetylase